MVYRTDGCIVNLLFAVPNSPLAQPWNVWLEIRWQGLIGVACTQYLPDLTSALASQLGLPFYDDDY